MAIKTILVLGVGALALSGCAATKFATKLNDFDKLETEVNGMSATTTMPTTGSATYTGTSAIAGSWEDSNIVVLGDTTMTANFATARVTGTIDDLVGADLNDRQKERYDNGDLGVLAIVRTSERADGTIAIRDGVIAGNTFAATADGDFTMDGYNYVVGGGVDGEFRGTGATAIAAEDGATFSFTRNGTAGTGTSAEIYATR
ncbi:hypothetical protein [Maritimibacter sp. DP1N21-5]|uniref:hypothetical protein n=1 Tax=Maritimibacter sp. DP1N21-5 TaxID=2836867 RepID=UPI001C48E163|nr:hypothetical protein [Maritimibacter sp. DP1N21-5]MBV7409475.1 hypothetical protein [Maritimibacter sp. DP1N21-5]